MEPYDLISRISEASKEDLETALKICLRFFTESGMDDLKSIVIQAETQIKNRPEPFDLFELLYKNIQRDSHERAMALFAATEWANENQLISEAIDIEPSSWKVSLKVKDAENIDVETKKDPSFLIYEYPLIIVEDKNNNSKKVFVDFEIVNNWYKEDQNNT